MSTENEETSQNPWTRPGFIVSAVLVLAIVVLGGVLTIVLMNDDDGAPNATSTPSSSLTPTTAPPETLAPPTESGGASVCGLTGLVLEGTVTTAPAAEWAYEGVVAYPTSPVHGPGRTSESGVRTCFEHSPTGALYMAANAAAQGSGVNSAEWASAALATGPYREQLLSESQAAGGTTGVRMELAAFRMLSYDGSTARVELGLVSSSGGQILNLSGIYDLVWQSGDWLISTEDLAVLDVATVPNFNNYTPWGP